MNAAIITARAGSKSIRNKNVYRVAGRPLISYPIQAALDAGRIDRVYISTDGAAIARVGRDLGCEIIERPEGLRGDHVNHGDVIKHAVEVVDGVEHDLENVVLLLGNTVMVDGPLIDQALGVLDERDDLDSVMSVWEAADDHPLRSLEIHDGLLRPYGGGDREVSTERQSYPPAYYYDQGVWAFRKDCVQRRDGPNPWWWMGRRCLPIVRSWATGRDIHTLLDVSIAEWWLENLPDIRALGNAAAPERPEPEASDGREPAAARRAVKAVVFDFDGVILESAKIKTEAFLDLFADYPQHRQAILEHHLEHQGVSRYRKFDWIYGELLGEPLSESERDRLGSEFSRLVRERILRCPFVPGAREALATLHGRVPLFVASGTPQRELESIIRERELTGRFERVWGSPAEKSAVIRDVLDRYGLREDELLFVGDALSDHEAAAETGVRFVARETPETRAQWRGLGVESIPDLRGLDALVHGAAPLEPAEAGPGA